MAKAKAKSKSVRKMPPAKVTVAAPEPERSACEPLPVYGTPAAFERKSPASALLLQPARVTSLTTQAMPMMRLAGPNAGQTSTEHTGGGDGNRVSILSQTLPEATSYTGRNYMTLKDVKGALFRKRSGDGPLIVFDGNAYVDCGNPQHLQGNPAAGFTIEAWVKTQDTKGPRFIVAHGKQGREFFLRIWDGVYEFGVFDGTRDYGLAGVNDPNGKGEKRGNRLARQVRPEDIDMWVHLAGVYDRKAGKWLLYRNGSLIDSQDSANGPFEVDATWTIGAIHGEGVSVERFFKGSIAEVRLWTVARSADEIGAGLYSLTADGTQGTLGGYWRLNEDSGSVAFDSAPRKWHGAVWRPGGALGEQARKARLAEAENRKKALRAEADTAREDLEQAKKLLPAGVPAQGDPRLTPHMGPLFHAQTRAAALDRRALDAESDWQKMRLRDKAGEPARAIGALPINDLSALIRKQDSDKVDAAFRTAQASGYFDPLVFPRLRGLMTDVERSNARTAIKTLRIETFRTFYQAGQHLILQRNFAGETTYSFMPTPAEAQPRLILIEEYRLSSFLGQYGVGRPLRTFSLLPGEKTKLTVKVSSKSTTTTTESSSIFDSYSQESASEYEKALSEEQSTTTASGENFDYHAEASGGASCSFGHVEASAGVSGGTNSSREQFGKSVSNATSKHAAKASNNRNVDIKNATEKRTEDQQESEVIREIENINIGRTLNFVFRQMNQEYITLLHLVDVRLGFADGIDPMREVPLYEMDNLLRDVIAEQGGNVAEVKACIVEELAQISDFRGDRHEKFVIPVDEKGSSVARYRVNKDYMTPYSDQETGTARKVPGIIVSAKSMVMRTNDVVVEAAIGESPALDPYAEGLQDEEVRTKKLGNDRAELENEKLRLETEKNRLLLSLVTDRDTELLKLYTQALTASPVDSAPKRVISVWEPANGVRLADKL